jgi:hypothetical protein
VGNGCAISSRHLLNGPLARAQVHKMRKCLADESARNGLELIAGHLWGQTCSYGFDPEAGKNALGDGDAYYVAAVRIGGNTGLVRPENLFKESRMEAPSGLSEKRRAIIECHILGLRLWQGVSSADWPPCVPCRAHLSPRKHSPTALRCPPKRDVLY